MVNSLCFYLFKISLGFPGVSVVKKPSANARDMGSILGQEHSLEKEMATHFSILAWEMPWTEEPGGLQSMGSPKSQTWLSDWTTTYRFFIFCWNHSSSLMLNFSQGFEGVWLHFLLVSILHFEIFSVKQIVTPLQIFFFSLDISKFCIFLFGYLHFYHKVPKRVDFFSTYSCEAVCLLHLWIRIFQKRCETLGYCILTYYLFSFWGLFIFWKSR